MVSTVLVIEDHKEMADNIAAILKLAHYNVICANDGKAGVELAQKHLPDLILCDIMMPELDGYGVVHILNSDPETSIIPFVFLTAKADKSDFRAGMNLGADDYITKPFDGVDLLRVVEMRLRKSELMKSSGTTPRESSFDKTKELKNILAENRRSRMYKKKDLIFMEGQTPNDLFYIERGRVKTYKVNYDGKELITTIHQEGDFLGFVPLLEDKPYNENAEVLEETKVSVISKYDFIDLIYSNKDVAQKFIRLLSNNLEEMEDRLLDIAYQSVRQRVANALLKMNDKFKSAAENDIITIARRDISGMVGTATESLNRTLAEFKEEGLIEISREGLRIKSKQKLEKLIR